MWKSVFWRKTRRIEFTNPINTKSNDNISTFRSCGAGGDDAQRLLTEVDK